MRLSRLTLQNFRCYKDSFSLDFDDFTVLVGKNDIGKSTILEALAIFFDEATMDSDDGSTSGDKNDIQIICEFDDFPMKVILDSECESSLSDEYLLNGQNRLEIHKVYNGTLQKPRLSSVFLNALHPSKKDIHDLHYLTISKLKERAKKLGIDLSEVDERVASAIRSKIWNSFSDQELVPTKIFLDKDDAKNLWERLKTYLPSYALFKSDRPSTDQDQEAQDPMKAAIKEALKLKEEELNNISKFVEKEVSTIAQLTLSKLKEMDPSLADQLSPRFTPPNWSSIFKVNLTGDEDVPINKRGSGTRRLILLNFFRAKAEQLFIDKPSIIYAVEEPETSQHPNNQRMLLRAFSDLANQPDSQVILSTHTPVLARLVPDENLRFLCTDSSGKRHVYFGDDTSRQHLANTLGVLPEHDVKIFLGVEGINDINFLVRISKVLRSAGENIPDLGEAENSGQLIFIPLGGSNLALWKTRMANLNRPEYYIFDRDSIPPKAAKYQTQADEYNLRTNCKAVITSKKELENYLHPNCINAAMNVKVKFGDFDDVPVLVAQTMFPNWSICTADVQKKKECAIKKRLNSQVVELMTPELLTIQDPNNDIRNWLSEIASYL